MKRVNLFLAILVTSIAALIALTAIGFAIFTSAQTNQHNSDWMGQMWGMGGGMMGKNQAPQSASSQLLPYFGVLFAVMVSITMIGVIGLAYYLLYPQIKFGVVREPMIQTTTNHSVSNAVTPYESVIKTLTDDECNVINVLNAHNGKYLQKYIRKETGLSRLKTHRIISRLAEREIVSIEKTGNTNQVYLANWLNNKTSDSK